MESKNDKRNSKKGRVKGKLLPIGRRVTRNIADEPEMKELKRMIDAGELDRDRTIKQTEERDSDGQS